jgi:hypothetical protein
MLNNQLNQIVMAKLTRRYKRGIHPAFDNKFDLECTKSKILNAGAPELPNISTKFWDATNIKLTIAEYEGDEEGNFYKPDEKYPYRSTISAFQDRLDDLQKSFDRRNQTRALMGMPFEEEMTGEILTKRLQLEASMDVSLSELATLKEWLTKAKEKQEEVRKDTILKYGLQCAVSLRNGKISTIDGQKVFYIDETYPVIKDEESPYDGMAVSDYRKMATMWKAQRRQKRNERLKQLQARAKSEGLIVPKHLPAESLKTVSRTSLPEWPQWAENQLIKQEQ